VPAFLALLAIALMLGHKYVPNAPGNLGSLLETFLPWLGLSIPVLAAAAAWRRSATAAAAIALTTAVWLGMFGHLIVPGKGGGPHNLRVLTHNVGASNPDPAGTAEVLLADDPDIIALQELTGDDLNAFHRLLRPRYPHRINAGTVALWSRHPYAAGDQVDIGMGWPRALRAEVRTPAGPVAVYVAHLASVRVGTEGFSSARRNTTVTQLGERIAAEKLPRVVVMGDLNGTAYDRELAPLTYGLTSAHAAGGWGFGFSWPAGFPMARIDHILIRGVTATDARVLPATASDHRPVAADLRL
jgi:vancomycin resistance protein VanJ